jgi:hypothetical protein
LLTLLDFRNSIIDTNFIQTQRPSAPGYFVHGVAAAGSSKRISDCSQNGAVPLLKSQLDDLLCLWVDKISSIEFELLIDNF